MSRILIWNWRTVLKKAWSVRLFALSVALQLVGTVMEVRGSFAQREGAAMWLQVGGVAIGIAGLIARFIYQDSINKKDEVA